VFGRELQMECVEHHVKALFSSIGVAE